MQITKMQIVIVLIAICLFVRFCGFFPNFLCYYDSHRLAIPSEPWKTLRPCKLAEEAGRGKFIGQAQHQMESYLDCVNSIYSDRSMIPHGLHNSQIVFSLYFL